MSTLEFGLDTFGDVTVNDGGELLPQVVLAAIAGRTTRIRLGSAA